MKFTLNDLLTVPRSIKPDRRQFIGGSDARIIMSPDEAALIRLEGKAWRDRTGGFERQSRRPTGRRHRGAQPNLVRAEDRARHHRQHPAMGSARCASISGGDRGWLRPNTLDAVFEAKFFTPRWSFSEEAAAEKHMAQPQHNMWVTNARSAVLSIITGGGKWVEMTSSTCRRALPALSGDDRATVLALPPDR